MRILIVEHDKNLLNDLNGIVTNALPLWHIENANSIEIAQNTIDKNIYDIVLSDFILDHTSREHYLDGLKLASFIRSKGLATYIIIISSYLGQLLNNVNLERYTKLDVDYIDRNMVDYNKFKTLLELQLKRIDNKISHKNTLVSLLDTWKPISTYYFHSFSILLINGLDVENERRIAIDSILWQGIYCRNEAQLLVCQPNDVNFSFISHKLGIHDFPTLVLGGNPEMSPCIKLGSAALKKLTSQEDGLRKLFVKMHVQLKNGLSLEKIRHQLLSHEFWDWLKWGVNEFKEFIPYISFGNG